MAAEESLPSGLAVGLLHVESHAARIEAHATADPALGRLWRAEAALADAVASVGLEDVGVCAGDFFAKATEARVSGPEGQGRSGSAEEATKLANGITMERVAERDGYAIRLRGKAVDGEMADTVMREIERLLEPG